MIDQMMSQMAPPKPAKKKDASYSKEVEITPPDGLDLSEFEEGKEGDIVSRWKLEGGKLCLVSVAGLPVQSTEETVEEETVEGEIEDEEEPDGEEVEVESEAATEVEEKPSKNAGDRFMKKFRPENKRVF